MNDEDKSRLALLFGFIVYWALWFWLANIVAYGEVVDMGPMIPVQRSAWRWSPDAAHHSAAVAVRCGNGFMSGCLVKQGSIVGVLTARHGISGGQASGILTNGQQVSGIATIDRTQADNAWIILEAAPAGTTPLAIAATAPAPGERCEVLGYGGPQSSQSGLSLRHYYVTFRGINPDGTSQFDGTFIGGDSGGPILNSRQEVISLVTGGPQNAAIDWTVCPNGIGPSWQSIRDFAGRVEAQCPNGCPGGNCPQPGGWGGGQGGRGGFPPQYRMPGRLRDFGEIYPPQQQPIQQPIQQPLPAPPQIPVPPAPKPPVSPQIVGLMPEIKAEIAKAVQEGIAGIKIPEGKPGERGPKGDTGPAANCDALVPRIEALEKRPAPDCSALIPRIEALEKRCDSPAPKPPSQGISHLVLVRSLTADYWPRLADELKRARGHVAPIEESDPPAFPTELPALVGYKNGVPVYVARGVRNVSDALSKIYRDEASFLNLPQ